MVHYGGSASIKGGGENKVQDRSTLLTDPFQLADTVLLQVRSGASAFAPWLDTLYLASSLDSAHKLGPCIAPLLQHAAAGCITRVNDKCNGRK